MLAVDPVSTLLPDVPERRRAPARALVTCLRLLVDSGVTVTYLRMRYGLTPELMIMMRYSLDDWLALGLDEETLAQVDDAQWPRLFGTVSRVEVRAAIGKCASDEVP